MLLKQTKRVRRHRRVRAKVRGTSKVPRLCVFRSSKHIYAQLVDDDKGRTLASVKDSEIKSAKPQRKTKNLKENKQDLARSGKVVIAFEMGKLIGQKALEKKIKNVKFDRAGYKYHGRVKALAQGAREAGLEF